MPYLKIFPETPKLKENPQKTQGWTQKTQGKTRKTQESANSSWDGLAKFGQKKKPAIMCRPSVQKLYILISNFAMDWTKALFSSDLRCWQSWRRFRSHHRLPAAWSALIWVRRWRWGPSTSGRWRRWCFRRRRRCWEWGSSGWCWRSSSGRQWSAFLPDHFPLSGVDLQRFNFDLTNFQILQKIALLNWPGWSTG